MTKNNFIMYKDFKTTLDLLSNEQAGKLIKAVYAYVNGRVEPNFKDGMLKIAFNILKTQLERDLELYKKKVRASQENGKLGGRPKKEKPKEPKEPTRLNDNPAKNKKPRKGDSVSVSVSDSVNDSDILKEKDMSIPDKPKKSTKRFIIPTVKEIEEYCNERKNNVNPNKFFDFYESKGWLVGKNKMKNWKAAVRTWENKNNTPRSNYNDDSLDKVLGINKYEKYGE